MAQKVKPKCFFCGRETNGYIDQVPMVQHFPSGTKRVRMEDVPTCDEHHEEFIRKITHDIVHAAE